MDEEFIKHIAHLLDFGYNQQFEVQMPISINNDMHIFSAQLNRDYLKDNEKRIIKKYSRATEKEFVLFGLLTQTKCKEEKSNLFALMKADPIANWKEGITNIILALSEVERTFSGKMDNEYVVDPIAIYMEL